ncbi:hypothetical protein PVAND_011406 [Polypedilum vanderplanki]|uniref:4'-phosphopantetheine phosphatase n=1 Tax=Polypedilum vanderplanki TaxID=319348 RepID=A0A9J6CJZ0_POLVA|nr:hypothetical protein PVAND_011406 [Polypedilum vanderplanki]
MYEKISKFINIEEYIANFEFDLNKDEKQKIFWKNQMLILIEKFSKQIRSYKEDEPDETKEDRIVKFQNEYLAQVNILMKSQDFLSVRQLLMLNERLLNKYGFFDVWRLQKLEENTKALSLLGARLEKVDNISDNRKRWENLFCGLLASNIFDSGSSAVQDILSNNINFGFHDALDKIQRRPWLIDNFDEFFDTIEKRPFKCIAFFCDNSGIDFVLGVLPLTVEFLKMNTKVILIGNSSPSLNDITYNELKDVVQQACESSDIIRKSYENKCLILGENGNHGCCLNFMDIDENVLDTMISMEVDLIVIEGVGRSIHTNFNAKFKCQSLKLAVIKNKFLAECLGGVLFDAICKYE